VQSGYKPPTLKDKTKWSAEFQLFVKECLVKNPKKRPAAERVLCHPFLLAGDLTKRQALDLLAKVALKIFILTVILLCSSLFKRYAHLAQHGKAFG
jgi:serine/threonine protein kinase